ncbi:MAG: hypothetical protein V3S43_06360 [Acidimicrobiia bacterium]
MSIRTEVAQTPQDVDQERLALLAERAVLFDAEVYATESIDDTDSPYTVLETDHTVICDTTNASITVNLPAAGSRPGVVYNFKKTSTLNSLTIDPDGAELIDNAATAVITAGALDAVRVQSDGTEWWII